MSGKYIIVVALFFCASVFDFVISNNVVCPGGLINCREKQTCCHIKNGTFSCCPYEKATCCSGGKYCCPSNLLCDVQHGICVRKPTLKAQVSLKPELKNVICPGGEQCPDKTTCCPVAKNKYGCCPYDQGVCCPDKTHCCPKGLKCGKNSCVRADGAESAKPRKLLAKSKQLTESPKLSASITSSSSAIICPDQRSQCPTGSTCCKLTTGQWGCCPIPSAVCCSDHVHCCPQGTTCDLTHGRCVHSDGSLQSWYKKLQAVVICPDGKSQCPANNTCCLLASGQWGCCPMKNAVCCKDGRHCCPFGSKCDVTHGRCVHNDGSVIDWLPKRPAITESASTTCPDGQSHCPDGTTCCQLTGGQWGCCPFPNAVCCLDHVHCCPAHLKCDTVHGKCTSKDDRVSIPWLSKFAAHTSNETPKQPPTQSLLPATSNVAGLLHIVEDDEQLCGNSSITTNNKKISHNLSCRGGTSCCKNNDDSVIGCCPYAQGTCCAVSSANRQHSAVCCPKGCVCSPDGVSCQCGNPPRPPRR